MTDAITHTKDGDELIPVNDVTDIEAVLEVIWPDGWIPRDEFFAFFGIQAPMDRNHLISHFGVSQTILKKADLADFLWDRSNVELLEKNENL